MKNDIFHRFQQEPQLLISQRHSLRSFKLWQGSLAPRRVSVQVPGKVGAAPAVMSQPVSGALIKTINMSHFLSFI